MANQPVGQKPGGTTGAVGQKPEPAKPPMEGNKDPVVGHTSAPPGHREGEEPGRKPEAEHKEASEKVQSAPGTKAEEKLLGKPKAGPPLLREADADDFALALKNVIGPLPNPKQWEAQKLMEAFMDYALRGAPSFQEALRSKYP